MSIFNRLFGNNPLESKQVSPAVNDYYNELAEKEKQRIALYTNEVIKSFQSDMESVYEKAKNNLGECVYYNDFPIELLVEPYVMVKYLTTPKKNAQECWFGIGGLEYLDKLQLKERCALRLSIQFYSNNGVNMPFDAFDYYESLAEMDLNDAREWLSRTI